MKKFYWLMLVLVVVILSTSACSLKKSEVQEVQEINNNIVQSQEITNDLEVLAEKDSNQIMKQCNVGELLFQYPSPWGDCKETDDGISFRTDDDIYQVDLALTLSETTNEDYNNNKEYSFNNYELINSNGEVFEVAQGGALMGGFIGLNNNYYKFYFNIISDQAAPENLEGVWSPDLHNVSKDDLISILRSAELNRQALTLERCGEEPTKISSLKVGDFYKTHKIKEISGNLLEKNCENSCSEFSDGLGLQVLFDGEETVSGYLVHTDYVFSLLFIPDDKTWTPSVLMSINNDGYVLNGLSCSNSFFITNDNDSVISKFSNIQDFLINSKDGDKYPERVSITVKNLEISFLAGGEGGTFAELVDIQVIK